VATLPGRTLQVAADQTAAGKFVGRITIRFLLEARILKDPAFQ
jgi:hypothetical protein